MRPIKRSCKLVGPGGLCCGLMQEHSVSNLEGWCICVLIMYLLPSVLGPAHMRLSKSPSFGEALYNLLLVHAYVRLSTGIGTVSAVCGKSGVMSIEQKERGFHGGTLHAAIIYNQHVW